MTRRLLLIAAAPPMPAFAPSDELLLNDFAAAYNDYVEQLRRNHIDLRRWQRVVRAWRRLNREDGL